ncbi:MAG: hypothetical protein WC309_02885, partial [Candidatus Paceibacterota bacterium]
EIEGFVDSLSSNEIVIMRHSWINERLARIQIVALVFNVLVPIDVTLCIKDDKEVLISGHATLPFSLLSIFHRRSVTQAMSWLGQQAKLYIREAMT